MPTQRDADMLNQRVAEQTAEPRSIASSDAARPG
jgi:hypothetical protein